MMRRRSPLWTTRRVPTVSTDSVRRLITKRLSRAVSLRRLLHRSIRNDAIHNRTLAFLLNGFAASWSRCSRREAGRSRFVSNYVTNSRAAIAPLLWTDFHVCGRLFLCSFMYRFSNTPSKQDQRNTVFTVVYPIIGQFNSDGQIQISIWFKSRLNHDNSISILGYSIVMLAIRVGF